MSKLQKRGNIGVISAMSQHSKTEYHYCQQISYTHLMKILNTKMFHWGNSHNEDILYNIKQWRVYRCRYSWVYACIHKKKKSGMLFCFFFFPFLSFFLCFFFKQTVQAQKQNCISSKWQNHKKYQHCQCLLFFDFLWDLWGERDWDLDFFPDFLGDLDRDLLDLLGVLEPDGDLQNN